MDEDKTAQATDSSKELEFDDSELLATSITDKDIANEDKQKKEARKKAKKRAKSQRTPREQRRARIKKSLAIGAVIIVIMLIVALIPASRWAVLNFAGLRNSIVFTFLEQETKQPISGVTVTLDSVHHGTTDAFGRVRFSGVQHGKFALAATKPGYSKLQATFTSDLGTDASSPQHLKAIGIKVDVAVRDWLSQRSIANATVSSGESKAQTDKNGNASLVVLPTDSPTIEIAVAARGYHSQKIAIGREVKAREVSLVAAQKNYFISNRNRRYDIFSSNLDGSNQRKIIEATGKENPQLLQFTVHRSNKLAILVANRDGLQVNGRIVAGIYVVDLEKATLEKIDEGSDVRLIGWANDFIVYQKTNQHVSYEHRHLTQLSTINATTKQLSQVAQANYFVALGLDGSRVFYVPTDAYREIKDSVLTGFDTSTGGRQKYAENKQISYLTNPAYGIIEMQTDSGENIELIPATGATRAIDRQPGTDRSFMLSTDGKHILWTDRRDGQGALVIQNTESGDERVVARIGGMVEPVRFVSSTLAVVRIATSDETADYVVHLATGKFAKIVDAVNVGSLWND